MSSAKSKPRQQPAKVKSTFPTKATMAKAKAKTPASTRLKNSTPRTSSKDQKISPRREFSPASPSTLALPTKIAKLNADVEEEEDEEEELRQAESLLAQIWHRNKNQHRGQKWWKWVSLLKRGLRDLGRLGGTGDVVGAVVAKEGKDAARDLGEAEMVRRRMARERARREERKQVERWLREVVLGRCWLAFSTLVADRQFSTLGVVLLALLARVGKIVGLPLSQPAIPVEAELTPGQQAHIVSATSLSQTGVDRGEVVERVFGGRKAEQSQQEVSKEEGITFIMVGAMKGREASEYTSEGKTIDEKLGNVNNKGVTESLPANMGVGDSGKEEQSICKAFVHGGLAEKTVAVAERKKKRRKKGNAIDDLFGSLS